MANAKSIEIDIIIAAEKALGDITKLRTKMEGLKSGGDAAKKAGEDAEGMGASFGKAAIGIAAVAASMAGIISASKEFITLAQTQELAETKLTTAMRMRGDVTGEQTERFKKQASALQEVTGIGDELIIQGQAMLVSFGAAGDGLEALTPQMLNMAVGLQTATGGVVDLQGNAALLGKALNGQAGALTKAGVLLTKLEVAAIDAAEGNEKAALVAKVIEANYGGMAEAVGDTSVGAYQKLDAAIGDAKENLGFMLMEVLKPGISIIKQAVDWFKQLTDRTTASGRAFTGIAKYVAPVIGLIAAITAGMVGYSAVTALTAAANISLAATFTTLWAAVTGPVGLVIAAIVAIGAALYALYEYVEPVQKAVDYVWASIVKAWDIISPIFGALWDVVSEVGALIWDVLVAGFEAWWEIISTVATTVWDFISALVGFNDEAGASVDIMGLLKKAVDFVKKGVLGLQMVIRGIRGSFSEFKNVVTELWDAITSLRFDKIGSIMVGASDRISKAFKRGANDVLAAKLQSLEDQKWADAVAAAAAAKAAREAAEKAAEEKRVANASAAKKAAGDAAQANKAAYDAQKKALDSELALESEKLNAIDAKESEKLELKLDYLNQTIEAAKKFHQETVDLENAAAILVISIEKKKTDEQKKDNDARLAIREKIEAFRTQQLIERSNEEDAALLEEQVRLESELQTLNEWLESKELSQQEYEDLRESARSAHLDRMASIEAKHREEREELEKNREDAAKKLAESEADARVSAAAGAFSAMKGLASDDFETQKAFAVAETIMNTWQAATAALTAGPIIGPILAGIIGAMGLANAAKIAAQQPGFAQGGFTGVGSPDQPAGIVHRGEQVFDAPTTSKYRKEFAAMQAGATPEQAFGVQAPGAPPSSSMSNVSVDLNGKFVINGGDLELIVREAIHTGRRTAY